MNKSIIEFLNVLSQSREGKNSGEIYIFSVAIDDYDFELKLNHCKRDSEYLIDAISSKSLIQIKTKNIYKLYDKKATKNNIIKNFRKLNRILTPKDELIIHIAGHSNINLKTNFFIPSDGDKNDIYTNISSFYLKEFITRTNHNNCILILNTFSDSEPYRPTDKKSVQKFSTKYLKRKFSIFSDLILFLRTSEKNVTKSIWHYANSNREKEQAGSSIVIVDDSRELSNYLVKTKMELDLLISRGLYIEALQRVIKITQNNDFKLREQAHSLLYYLSNRRESRDNLRPINSDEAKGLTSNLVHQIHESGYYLIPKSNALKVGYQKSETKIILYTSADTIDQTRLRLDEEFRAINLELLRSKFRDDYELIPCLSSRITDLQRELLDKKPYIVHFAGHGSCTGIRMVADERGNSQLIKNEPLAGLFKLFSSTIDCVFLNSCYSTSQSGAISQSINNVICMSNEISDNTAIAFARAFYMSLGSGKNIPFSFEFAKNSIDMQGCEDKNLPTLITKSKI